MEKDSLIAVIEGQEIEIDDKLLKHIPYFQEWLTLNDNKKDIKCEIKSVVSLNNWERIVKILTHYDFCIPQGPKVTSTRAHEHLDKFILSLFGSLRSSQINSLFVAVKFLKIEQIQNQIACYLACQVYLDNTD